MKHSHQINTSALLLASAVLAASLLGACSKREDGIGPAQKAGIAVDNAGDKVARDLHDKLDKANAAAAQATESARQAQATIAAATADAAQDASKGLDAATEKVGQKVERAGEKIQEAAHK